MRKLIDQPNIDPADSDYLKGKTRDKTELVNGTIWSNAIMGDIIQFFQKLVGNANITENGLPDNESEGHQLIEALSYRERNAIEGQLSGVGAISANYSGLDTIVITASGDIIVTPSNIPDKQNVKLVVIKSADDTVSFSGVGGSLDGKEIGVTTIYYELWKVNGVISVIQKNRQFGGSFVIGDLSINLGTLDSVTYFDFQINDNILHLEAEIVITTTAAGLGAYTLGIPTSDKMGRFKQLNQKISGSMSHDYSAIVGDVGALSISDLGSSYSLRLAKEQNTPWPASSPVTIRFSANVIIK